MPYTETPITGERSSLDPYGFLLPSELEAVIGSGLQIVEPGEITDFTIPAQPNFTWSSLDDVANIADVGRYRMIRRLVNTSFNAQLVHARWSFPPSIVHLPVGYVRHGVTNFRIEREDPTHWNITRLTNRGRGRPWSATVELCRVSVDGRRSQTGEEVLRFRRSSNEDRTTHLTHIVAAPMAALINYRAAMHCCVVCGSNFYDQSRLAHRECRGDGWTVPVPLGSISSCQCSSCWNMEGRL